MDTVSSLPGDANHTIPGNAPTATTSMKYGADGVSTNDREEETAALPSAGAGPGRAQSGMPPPASAESAVIPVATTVKARSEFSNSESVSVGADAMEVVGGEPSSAAGESAETEEPARPSMGIS